MLKSIILASAFIASLGLAQDCIIQVPPNPLTAVGLATPYQVSGDGCSQRGAAPSFVECAIYDNAGNMAIYAPLVIDKGDKPNVDFVPPVQPTVAAGAAVACWFGTNAATLTLAGAIGGCVNGIPGSIFGQFATCGGAAFMAVYENLSIKSNYILTCCRKHLQMQRRGFLQSHQLERHPLEDHVQQQEISELLIKINQTM
jgi:hypothetical protein